MSRLPRASDTTVAIVRVEALHFAKCAVTGRGWELGNRRVCWEKRSRLGREAMYESLERRQMFAVAFPTDAEQLMLELLNRARANPAAEATLHGLDLNEGLAPGTISAAAKQPLAFNLNLIAAARSHSEDMLARDYFAHENPDGQTPGFRMSASGYAFTDTWGWGENLAYRSLMASIGITAAQLHADLFIDEGVSGRLHRINALN